MKISFLRELQSKFKNPRTEEEYNEVLAYIKDIGISLGNLYQELEMSSTYANIHKDVTYKKSNVSLHSHSFYEVLFCRAADRVKYLVGSRQYKLSAGDIIIVAPGVSHMPILPDDMQYPYERDILWINADFMKQALDLFPNSRISNIKSALVLHTKSTAYSSVIGESFANGVRETIEQKNAYDKAITAHTILIITYIVRALAEAEELDFEPEKPTLINALIEHIEGHLDEKLSLDEVAAHFYTSRGTINNLFRQNMDTSFYKFVTQRRLILAKVLIGEGKGLDEISLRCGFSDYSTFYKAFKKEFGISPREFSKI